MRSEEFKVLYDNQLFRFIFRAKKLETKSATKKQENVKNSKVSFGPYIDVRRENEDSWLNAIKTKIAFVKGRMSFSSKSTTTADARLMESL